MRSRPVFAVLVAACLATFATANNAKAADIDLMTTGARQPDAARALSNYLQLESSVAAVRKNGMVPAPR
jgi:hypothetical protein